MDNRANPILQIEDLSMVYKTRGSLFKGPGKKVVALNRISLRIYKGEIFGLVGESGSGKTTVGRLIVSLEATDQGKIFLDGVEITGLKGRALKDFRRRVQMIFQDPYQSLNPQRAVYDTISEPLVIHKIGNAETRLQTVEEAMKSVGLSPPRHFLHRYPHRLSGGQRQRVAIARAMITKPQFVIADEPTSMLDASISAQIFNILLEMREKMDATLLFITHSLAAARYLCDRIAVIYRGNLVEIGPGEEIITSPRHPYTQALIDAIPKFGQRGDVKRYRTLLKADRGDENGQCCPFFPRCRVACDTRCGKERPHLKELSSSHSVACFYVEEGFEV
ncbi:MAG: oligopeptide/dipeptide ABC transporter ATP-binding protein [Pseudomonadota bacterium]